MMYWYLWSLRWAPSIYNFFGCFVEIFFHPAAYHKTLTVFLTSAFIINRSEGFKCAILGGCFNVLSMCRQNIFNNILQNDLTFFMELENRNTICFAAVKGHFLLQFFFLIKLYCIIVSCDCLENSASGYPEGCHFSLGREKRFSCIRKDYNII